MITKLRKQNFNDDLKDRSLRKRLMNPVAKDSKSPSERKSFSREERMQIVIDGQSNLRSIEEICVDEGITTDTFNKWTKELLRNGSEVKFQDTEIDSWKQEDKFRIVIEGKSGETSIAEICRRESITERGGPND